MFVNNKSFVPEHKLPDVITVSFAINVLLLLEI